MSNGNPDPYALLKIWIDFIKWAVVSVALVLISLIIDSGFKDRELGIGELNEYGRYVDLITDYNKVAERRLLAQFFAYVSPSEKLREGWEKYFEVVNAEYDSTISEKEAISNTIEKIDTTKADQRKIKKELEIKRRELEIQTTPTFDVKEIGKVEFHPIQPSETLGSISEKYGVPIRELVRLNPDLIADEIKGNNLAGKTIIRIK